MRQAAFEKYGLISPHVGDSGSSKYPAYHLQSSLREHLYSYTYVPAAIVGSSGAADDCCVLRRLTAFATLACTSERITHSNLSIDTAGAEAGIRGSGVAFSSDIMRSAMGVAVAEQGETRQE